MTDIYPATLHFHSHNYYKRKPSLSCSFAKDKCKRAMEFQDDLKAWTNAEIAKKWESLKGRKR